MASFFETNSIYVVLAIVLLIWAGISIFLFSIDLKIKKLEKNMMNLPAPAEE